MYGRDPAGLDQPGIDQAMASNAFSIQNYLFQLRPKKWGGGM